MRLFLFSILFFTLPYLQAQAESEINYSLPFLVIDLDDDGINFVPLSNSKASFDSDGDGISEKQAWIESGEAFLISFTSNEVERHESIVPQSTLFITGGFDEILSKDRNSDFIYDHNDADILSSEGGRELLKAGFLTKYNQNGKSEKENIFGFCKIKSIKVDEEMIDIEQNGQKIERKGIISCKNGKSYNAYQVRFKYQEVKNGSLSKEDLCEKIQTQFYKLRKIEVTRCDVEFINKYRGLID